MSVQVPELITGRGDVSNAIFKARDDARADRSLQMQEEIFKQEQDPMSTQNQLRKMQLEKIRGEVLRDTLEEAVTTMGAIDFNNRGDYESHQKYYDRRLTAAGLNLDEIPPGMRLTPIYKVGANGVQSDQLDADAMRKRALEIQNNLKRMAQKSSSQDTVGYANLAYRMSKDAYDEKKKEEENVDNLYRMIVANAENPDLVRRDVDNFNKKSKDYEFVLKPDETVWWLPEKAERWAGKTPPKYVPIPKGFTLKTVTELSQQIGITPEEFTDDAVALMKELELTPAQAEKAIRKRYAK